MPAFPRSEIVLADEVGAYHCWSRCVRRAFLCGQDPLTGKDFDYRRLWIRDFEQQLAGLFGIEIGFHAELANHIHLVLRTRPDVVETWSDEEVVRRWLSISHLTKKTKLQTPYYSSNFAQTSRSVKGKIASWFDVALQECRWRREVVRS